MLDVLLKPFWNTVEQRVRAGWRVLLTLVALLAMSFGAQLALRYAFGEQARALIFGGFSAGGAFVLATLGSLAIVGLACRFLDRRPLGALGLTPDTEWWLDLAFGVVLGAVLISGVLGVELAFGWVRVETLDLAGGEAARWAYLPVTVLVFGSVAVYEELIFRGYLIKNVSEGLAGARLGPAVAITVSVAATSSIFGLAHASNPHATVLGTVNIVVAGLMLASAYVMTGRLALPIGLHLTWNLFQNLYGMPVSGQSNFFYASVLSREELGPDWITGGPFGPEAGMTGLAAMLLGTLAIGLWQRARGRPFGVRHDIARWELTSPYSSESTPRR